MGTPAKEPRCRYVPVRFTEKEYVQLKAQMANDDYLSISKYIRAKTLDEHFRIRKKIVLTDRNLRNQINNLTAKIERIGVDYNQATKRFNTLSKAKRLDGTPVINARAANYYLKKLFALTKDLKEEVDNLVDMVDRINYDSIPHGEGGI